LFAGAQPVPLFPLPKLIRPKLQINLASDLRVAPVCFLFGDTLRTVGRDTGR